MAHTPGPFDLPVCLIQPYIHSDRLLQLNGRHIASFFPGSSPQMSLGICLCLGFFTKYQNMFALEASCVIALYYLLTYLLTFATCTEK